jgi:4-hydroxy-3-methylbut-2-en-1-yl diphosphate reductase
MTRVLLAAPRGFCAGVDRAVETVNRALAANGPPVYVRKHIVHNLQVVRELEARGAVFVDSEDDVPEASTVVLAAHGVEPGVHRRAAARRLATIDATCPLVKKVHAEVRRYAAAGYTIVLVGHAGHDEVVGTAGHAPESVVVVETADDARSVELPRDGRIAYVTQTTLSLDETAQIIAILRARFPAIVGPRKDDICYATTNRQQAVKAMLGEIDVLLVVGSQESSNSKRLVDTARAGGVRAFLIEDQGDIDEDELADAATIGITAGASTPEWLVDGVCDWFRAHGVTDIDTFGDDRDEGVAFRLPPELSAVRPVPAGSP